ncbi:potassium/proton antiporter [Thiohalorhabdus methylotrophus]|uniref:Potassium/proton antiporter n=1 Tax=Thiohalorhabdus methylotrophus TaxID=3242694 RepID=A0ABV4TT78_9GAMM
MGDINSFILAAGILVLSSILLSSLSARMGLPLLLIFLVVGMLAGEDGPGGIDFDDFSTAFLVGNLALAIILLDGGLRTRFATFRVALRPATILATWGVFLTTALVGGFATLAFGVDWRYGLLLGGMVASTDAAAVFSLLRHSTVQLNERVRSTLEIESGLNDPLAVFLVVGLVGLILEPRETTVPGLILSLAQQFVLGGLGGLLGGWLVGMLGERARLTEGLFALLIASGGLVVFAGVNQIGGSGFLAIYILGLVTGNWRHRPLDPTLQAMDGLAWLSQGGMFLLLGLLVTPSELLKHLGTALAVAFFLILVARPAAIFTGLSPLRFPWREMAFISWNGLRGAVPIILAIFPVTAGLDDSRLLFDIVFAVVLVSLLVQGPTLPWAARMLKVAVPSRGEPATRRELWRGERRTIELMQLQVGENAAAVGRNPGQMLAAAMDPCAAAVMVVRDGWPWLPGKIRAVRSGDRIWVIGDPDKLAHLFPLFATREPAGELAETEFFGEFAVRGDAPGEDLALMYGIPLTQEERGMALGNVFAVRIGRVPVVGDRVQVGRIQLVAREVQGTTVSRIGLKLH